MIVPSHCVLFLDVRRYQGRSHPTPVSRGSPGSSRACRGNPLLSLSSALDHLVRFLTIFSYECALQLLQIQDRSLPAKLDKSQMRADHPTCSVTADLASDRCESTIGQHIQHSANNQEPSPASPAQSSPCWSAVPWLAADGGRERTGIADAKAATNQAAPKSGTPTSCRAPLNASCVFPVTT